jgi:outer membrane lipoprotein carrier protein
MKLKAVGIAASLSVFGAALLSVPAVSVAHAEPPPKQASTELSTEQLVAKVQAFYDQAKRYRARFKQRYTIAAYDKTKDSEGEVVFEKPGKMSWRYSTNKNRVVSDGKVLKIYEEENKQMYEQDVNKSQYPAALSFLLGSGDLKKSFKLEKLDATQLRFQGGYVLLGVPLDPTPAYQKMLMYVDAKTFQVRRVLLIDAQKNKNRFDFSTPQVNEKVAPSEFQFTPPPGTRVIKP